MLMIGEVMMMVIELNLFLRYDKYKMSPGCLRLFAFVIDHWQL